MRNWSRFTLAYLFIVTFLLSNPVISTASGAIVYVDCTVPNNSGNGSSWGNACKTIQSGLSFASSYDQIWVAKGIYTENINLKTSVELYGGFSGNEGLPASDVAVTDVNGRWSWSSNNGYLWSVAASKIIPNDAIDYYDE